MGIRARLWKLRWYLPLVLVLAWYAAWTSAPGASFFMEDHALLAVAKVSKPADLAAIWGRLVGGELAGFNYRPLATSVYGLLGGVFGLQPVVFRVYNLALVVACCLGLVSLSRRLGGGPREAGLLALAWVLHPAVPNLIYWAVGCFDLSAALFTVLVLRLVWTGTGRDTREIVAVSALYLAACLCKEAVSPLALPLVLLGWRAGGGRYAARLALGLGVAGGLWAALYLRVADPMPARAFSADAIIALLQYLSRLPAAHAADAAVYHLFDPSALAETLTGAALLLSGLVVWGLSRRVADTRPLSGLVGIALLGAPLMLVPAALLVPILVAQPVRYLLLPVTLALPLVAEAGWALERLAHGRTTRLVQGTALALLAWQAVVSLPTPRRWVLPVELWRDEYTRDPNYTTAALFGVELLRIGGSRQVYATAMDLLTESERLVPREGATLNPCYLYSWRVMALWCLDQREAAVSMADELLGACALTPATVEAGMYPGVACIVKRGGLEIDMGGDDPCAGLPPLCPGL